MLKNISFYIKLLLLTLLFVDSSNAIELSIIPLKKPILDKITKQSKLTQGIIRPKSKPIKKVEEQKTSKEVLSPKSKPSKKIKESIAKTVEKKIQKNNSIIPRNKPLVINQ
jgi:soluble lytic murein transglycosylase